jgi:ubiquinone/menaquinone biosynthesis C-methylase UbiE
MAHRTSNRQRNVWVVSLLDVQPTDRVLEIGFGPGLAIAELARRAAEGHVLGIDHSAVMLRQARKRNSAAIRAGRVALWQASVDRMPSFDEPLDAIVAVNTLAFWPDPAEQLGRLRGLLRAGGRIAVASQPRCPGATADTTAQAGRELHDMVIAAGFVAARIETLPLTPPVACVLAVNPSGQGVR